MWSQQNSQWFRHSQRECFDQDAVHGDWAGLYISNVLMINEFSAGSASFQCTCLRYGRSRLRFVEGCTFILGRFGLSQGTEKLAPYHREQ
jgi:hypothetical protein